MSLSSHINEKANLIWAIADKLTGVYKPHEYGEVILPLTMADGSIKTITLENAKIQVSDNGRISTYALCKLDYIELGRTLNR